MKNVVTRNDVAKLANVSPAIVSYVLNNSNYVSEEKRDAVLKAVKELGYVPNQLARGLRTNKSTHFAFVCDNIQTELFSEVERIAFEKGYYVSLNYSRPDNAFIKMLVSRQLEGIFMTSNSFSAKQLNTIAANGIPMIFYKTRQYDDLDSRIVTLAPDYYDGVKKAVNYLALQGHKNIALIPPVKYRTKGISGDDFRVRAYVEALESNRLSVNGDLVCTTTATVEAIYESVFNMMVNFSAEERPSAFVVGNDYLAAQIIKYLDKLKLKVPGDVSIIGCDNTEIAPIISPALTTVDYSKTELARDYVDCMLDLIEGRSVEGKYVEVRLVIRDSA